MGVLSVGCYRAAARAVASLLGRQPQVRSIYLRRGVAAGEVAFGRSDIDLTIVVDEGADLVSLGALVSRLRRLVLVLGECLVFEPKDLDRWHETDPYRAAQDRDTAIALMGALPSIPRRPVSAEQAARRCAFLLEHYLPAAFRRGNRRDLTKFALDMWTAHGVATGGIPEPYPTRREAAETYRVPRSVDGLLASCLRAADNTHAVLLPGLPPAASIAPFRVLLPPTFEPRTFVILPSPDAPPPSVALAPEVFITTREALDLYVCCVNPFAWRALPPELELTEPPLAAFERACRFHGASHRLREPGFVNADLQTGLVRLDTTVRTVRLLERGESPHTHRPSGVPEVTSVRDYYGRVYPRARERAIALWEALERLHERTEEVTSRSGS